MPERNSAGRWQLVAVVVGSLALIAGAAMLSRGDAVPQSAVDAAAHRRAAVMASPERRGRPNLDIIDAGAQRAATPALIDVLRAADAMSKAGLLPQGAPQPPLIEILRSAQALSRAGLLAAPEPPPLIEILQAADALVKAGALAPPQPSLMEVLNAAQALADAGELAAAPDVPQGAPPLAPVEAAAPPRPAPPAPPPPPAPASDGGWYDDAYSARARDLVNGQRVAAGLPALSTDGRLVQAAGAYARVLSTSHWFAHTGPDGSTLVSRIQAAGITFNVPLGEVIAFGTESWPAEDLVQAWMDSPSHRSEILSALYTRVGVRCYFTSDAGGTVYCVMDFAG